MKAKNMEISLPARYQYQKDTRTEKEKMLSDNIVRSLSELNLERIRKKQSEPESYQYSEKYFFLCLTGLPPNPNQFGNLQLPGERVDYSVSGFTGSYTHEQYMKIVSEISVESEAKNISQIVNRVPSDRKIVILFHSFTTYIAAAYFHLYDHSKIFALIDIGGLSVTMHPAIVHTLGLLPKHIDQFTNNIDKAYQNYLLNAKTQKITPLQNKYQVLIFLKIAQGEAYYQIYEWIRNFPRILKLITGGRKDVLLPESLMNEKIVHYSYVKKLDEAYETRLKRAYSKFYGSEVKNVQQRFILSFEQGKHSLHHQPKVVQDINSAIRQYLAVLDLAHKL